MAPPDELEGRDLHPAVEPPPGDTGRPAERHPAAMLVQPAEVYWLSLVNAVFCTVLPVFMTMIAVQRIGAPFENAHDFWEQPFPAQNGQ